MWAVTGGFHHMLYYKISVHREGGGRYFDVTVRVNGPNVMEFA